MKYVVFLLGLGCLSFAATAFVGKNLLGEVQSSLQLPEPRAHADAAETMSAEEMELMKDMSATVDVRRSEIVDRLVGGAGEQRAVMPEFAAAAGRKAGIYGAVIVSFYARYKSIFIALLWVVPALALGFGGVLMLAGSYSGALSCCGFSFRFSALFLWLMSAAVAAVHIFANINLLLVLSPEFWLVPSALLFLSVLVLRRLDMNYPVWNEMVSAMFMPLAASVVVAGWGRFYPLFASLTSGAV